MIIKGNRLKTIFIAAGLMANWIMAMTEGGMTRIRMDAICAYQEIDGGKKLLVYTQDNSLFEIVEDIPTITSKLDSEFNINQWFETNL